MKEPSEKQDFATPKPSRTGQKEEKENEGFNLITTPTPKIDLSRRRSKIVNTDQHNLKNEETVEDCDEEDEEQPAKVSPGIKRSPSPEIVIVQNRRSSIDEPPNSPSKRGNAEEAELIDLQVSPKKKEDKKVKESSEEQQIDLVDDICSNEEILKKDEVLVLLKVFQKFQDKNIVEIFGEDLLGKVTAKLSVITENESVFNVAQNEDDDLTEFHETIDLILNSLLTYLIIISNYHVPAKVICF